MSYAGKICERRYGFLARRFVKCEVLPNGGKTETGMSKVGDDSKNALYCSFCG
jgi:hypothetical protein